MEIWDGEEGSETYKLAEDFKNSDKSSIPPMMRILLEEEGWVFGRTIVCVLECCCCASNAGEGEPQEEVDLRKDLRREAESMLGSDLDGLISTLSGIDIYASMEV
jgi:hypothetical protein